MEIILEDLLVMLLLTIDKEVRDLVDDAHETALF